jgi:hypothetical protein
VANVNITGKWAWDMTMIIPNARITYEFFDDGTCKYHNYRSGCQLSSRYEVIGNKIHQLDLGWMDEFSLSNSGDSLILTPIKNGRLISEHKSRFEKV